MADNAIPDTSAADRAERYFLGGVLRLPQNLEDVQPLPRVEDFRQVCHRLLWQTLLELWGESREITLVSVADRMVRRHWLEDLGGYTYLVRLWEENPTGYGIASSAELIRDHALRRRLAVAGQQITLDAVEPTGPARECLERAERSIFALAEQGEEHAPVLLAQVIPGVLERIDARALGRPGTSGILTGLEDLDQVTAGFRPGELVLLAARPSVGKTATGLILARNLAEQNHAVLFCSLEQSQEELAERLLAAGSGLPLHLIRNGRLEADTANRLVNVHHDLARLPLWVDDSPRQSALHIAASARRLRRRHQLACVVIDYLQIMEPEDRRIPRHEQVAGISRRLKALARELEVPLVALAQLSRAVESRADQRPRLADLRESGSLEQDADTVILLHRPEEQPDILELDVAKQRNGPTGRVAFRFDRARMRLEVQGGPQHDVFA